MRNSIKEKEALHFIWMTLLWKKIEMNIVHMSSNKKKHYLIVVRDDYFEWTKARVLFETKTWRMTKFLWENVICRHDCFEKLIVNDESESKEIFDELVQRYRIKKMMTSSYHFQINEMIKRNHKFLFNALFKMFDEELKSWMNNLHVVLWANRFIVKFIIDLITPRNDSGFKPNRPVWFRFLVSTKSNQIDKKPNHWNFDSVRFLSIWNRLKPTQKEYIQRRWDV
jgi:hypothetical protein